MHDCYLYMIIMIQNNEDSQKRLFFEKRLYLENYFDNRTEVEGKYKITKTVTVVMKKCYMILVLFNGL